MERYQIIEIKKEDELLHAQVVGLFNLMYQEMLHTGLMLSLHENGAELWLKGVKPTLGRFSVIFAVMDEGKMTAFAHGALRSTPEFLGNLKIGSITHIYVTPEMRKSGLGESLVLTLEKWFRDQNVHSIELQVLEKNPAAIAFWDKLGYIAELRQYRKILP